MLSKFIPFFRFSTRPAIDQIPSLKNFMAPQKKKLPPIEGRPTFHIETYGCQMNVSDSEIIRSVLGKEYTEV